MRALLQCFWRHQRRCAQVPALQQRPAPACSLAILAPPRAALIRTTAPGPLPGPRKFEHINALPVGFRKPTKPSSLPHRRLPLRKLDCGFGLGCLFGGSALGLCTFVGLQFFLLLLALLQCGLGSGLDQLRSGWGGPFRSRSRLGFGLGLGLGLSSNSLMSTATTTLSSTN